MSQAERESRRALHPRAIDAGALVLGLALALLAGSSLLGVGFYDAHDNLLNVHRIYEMEQCFADRQLPCRWVPDMGFGYGMPLFNYYPPSTSYLGASLSTFGLSSLDAVKLSMLLALLAGAAGMFALARSLMGPGPALVAATFYTWAPYRAADIFVRGALAETWGLALLPFVFWTSLECSRAPRATHRWAVATALAWSALLLTHPLVIILIAPFYAAWLAALVWNAGRQRATSNLVPLALAHVVAAALAAHFLLPALLERDLIHMEGLISRYSWNQYPNNFVTLPQVLFGARPWGYGAFHAPDGMSVFAGMLHWSLATAAGVAGAWIVATSGEIRGARLVGAFAGAGWIAVAMTLPISRGLWDVIPGLAYLQFPWRYLGVAAFGFSLAAGGAVALVTARARIGWALVGLASVAVVAAGWSYFRPAGMHVIEETALANPARIARMRHGALDYLPRAVDLDAFVRSPAGGFGPAERDPRRAAVVSPDDARVASASSGSDWIQLDVEVPAAAGSGAIVRINTYSFPNWTVTIDGEALEPFHHPDPLGRIHVLVPPGRHRVEASFEDTAVRRWGNALSVMGLAALGLWCGIGERTNARAR